MNTRKSTARVAGLLYLLMAVASAFGIMYVPSSIIGGNAAETVKNIMNSEILYRLGIISSIIGQVIFIFLVLTLNRLLKGVNEKQAKLMVTLVIAAVPIAFINELSRVAPLILLNGSEQLNVFTINQLNALVMVFLNLHQQGILIVGILWGLWLFPFAYLVIKSGFIPKILGIFLIIGCFAYLADSSVGLFFPQYYDNVSNILMLPLSIGEFSMILWLLIKGTREERGEDWHG